MSCDFILKNGNNCKHLAKKIIKINNYCTRHYNILIQQYNINDDYDDYIYNISSELNINKNDITFINKGNYGYVYKVLLDSKFYAVKYQNLNNTKNIIYYEYLLLKQFNDSNYIVKLYNNNKQYYTKKDDFAFIITEILYENLKEKKMKYTFNIEEIKYIGIQIINCIKYIHSKKYLYLDLKPENIMFINDNSNIIKLIDFNCCNKYINCLSEFYDNTLIKGPIGNMIFSSININKSYSGVRIDDIESVLWILLYLLDDDIIINIKKMKTDNKIIKLKESFIVNNKFSNHVFITEFINELKNYNTFNNKQPNYDNFIKILK